MGFIENTTSVRRSARLCGTARSADPLQGGRKAAVGPCKAQSVLRFSRQDGRPCAVALASSASGFAAADAGKAADTGHFLPHAKCGAAAGMVARGLPHGRGRDVPRVHGCAQRRRPLDAAGTADRAHVFALQGTPSRQEGATETGSGNFGCGIRDRQRLHRSGTSCADHRPYRHYFRAGHVRYPSAATGEEFGSGCLRAPSWLRRGPLAHLRPHSLIVLPRTKYPAGSRAGTPAWWVSTITELQSRCGTIDTEYPFYLDLLWLTPGAACSVSSSLALAFQSEELQHALLLLEARCVPCASCVVLLGSKLCCGKTFGVSRL